MAKSPVIIIGMHRSGTTMISQLLEELGLHAGTSKDSNHEARFFHRINEWLFLQSGARWDHPRAFESLVQNQEARALAAGYIRDYLLNSPRTLTFLGIAKYAKYRSVLNLDFAWGWKSPLNTFTLPVWLDIFPDAKVIHIYRHGVDVANSLRVRNRKDMRQSWSQRAYYRFHPIHWVLPKRGTFMGSVRCDFLEGGLSLWEEYSAQARTYVQQLGDAAIEIRYEDFLERPLPVLTELSQFCGLPASDDQIRTAAARVKLERAFAYKRDPNLSVLAEREARRLACMHY